jgi:hypothetical protein
MKTPLQDLPRLEDSSIVPAAANDATTCILVLDTNEGSFRVVVPESRARDLAYEMLEFLGEGNNP